MWGEPIEVPGDADAAQLDALRGDLEERMNSLAGEADRYCGHEAIDPAPSDMEPGR
jgi:hypothetical protein